MKKNVIIVLLMILSVGLCGYIVYNNVVNDTESKENVNNSNKQEENLTSISYSVFEDIIVNELSGLERFNSLSELPNENKLIMLYNLYKKSNQLQSVETFTKTDLENAKEKSSLATLDVTYDYICDMYGVYSINKDVVGYEYDKSTETYTYSSNLSHGALSEGIIYKKLVDYRKDNNKYILDYVYIFYNGGNMTSKEDVSIYKSVSDLLADKPLKTFSNKIDLPVYKNRNDALEYIETNYDEIESELQTYTYEFMIENDRIVLSNYYIK